MKDDELSDGGAEPAKDADFRDLSNSGAGSGSQPGRQDALQPCPSCGGTGRVVLLTSARACEACAGTGKTPADGRIELGRWHDAEGRLIHIIHEEVPIVEVREYAIEPDRKEAGPEEG